MRNLVGVAQFSGCYEIVAKQPTCRRNSQNGRKAAWRAYGFFLHQTVRNSKQIEKYSDFKIWQ